jgi:Na+-transporting NADH:ubiquinone oxidoreductase subunit NqrB
MTWRKANGLLAIASFILLIAMVVLWLAAWIGGFIGNTEFIGHVSMLALVLACAAMMTGYLAAWRADVPTDGE